MEAVCQEGATLAFAAEDLRGDREIVMKAVSQDATALRFASEEPHSRGKHD